MLTPHTLRPLGAVLVLLSSLTAQSPENKKAEAEFQRAEKAVAEARYPQALTLYRQLAARYPNTAWGKMAVLRTQPTAYLGWGDIKRNGPSNNRVDVVVMGDGTTNAVSVWLPQPGPSPTSSATTRCSVSTSPTTTSCART